MRLTRAGRLGDAEAAAEACLHRGFEVGDADGYYGGQLAVIRWFQGRDAELADLVTSTAASATLATSEYAFAIMVAAVLARAGREEAAATLAGATAGGVEQLPRSSTWTSAMAATVEAAHLLDDRDLAVRAAGLLEPFADLPVMPSLGVTCLGVAARSIGLAALTRGDLDEAVRRFEQAVAGNSRLRHRPATAVCRAELADTLVRRDRAGDRERAAGLWREAAEAAAAMEMPHRVRQWTALARRHSPVGDAALLVREAGGWTLRAHGVDQRLPDLVGIAHLAALLARPGRDVPVVELYGAVPAGAQAELDTDALRAYRRRLGELDQDIAAAEEDADLGWLERLQNERDALLDQVRSAVGLGGRARSFGTPQERARTAARKSIARALAAIARCDAALGGELRAAITTGSVCRYDPIAGTTPWRAQHRA